MANQDPIQNLFDAVRGHDDALNARAAAPTGDDYNALLDLIEAARERLSADAEAQPYRVTIRWGEASADDDVKTHSFASPSDRAAFLEGVDACVGWLDYEVESEEG